MKQILIGLILMVLLSGCGTGSKITPTPTAIGAVDAAVQLIQQDMVLRVTEQYIEGQRIEAAAKMTATQQVMDATATQQVRAENLQATQKAEAATAQAWEVTVQAGYAIGTATAQAASIQATSTAIADGTATSLSYVHATGTAQYQATQNSVQATQESAAWSAQATAQYAQAESAQLAAKRERMTNGVIAWGPWVVVLVVVIVASFSVYRKSQVGTIARDENGMMPGVMIFHAGKKQFISPDRMFSPVLTMDKTGITAPQLVETSVQESTTRRAQAVEAINALPPQTQRQGLGLMSQNFAAPTPRASIEVLGQDQVSGWVAEAETKLSEEI